MMEDIKLFLRFLKLVQRHFREERAIDFYALMLGLDPGELVRIIHDSSDSTLIEWLDVMEKCESENLVAGKFVGNN